MSNAETMTIHRLWKDSQLSITALSKWLKGEGASLMMEELAKSGCSTPFAKFTSKKFLLDTMKEMDDLAPRIGTMADKVTKYEWYLGKQENKTKGVKNGTFRLRREFSPWYTIQIANYLAKKELTALESKLVAKKGKEQAKAKASAPKKASTPKAKATAKVEVVA